MNTHGHRHVAESTGMPRLKQAFEELGIQNVNLSAFYLGNWLADMSQVNDPVADCFGKLRSELAQTLSRNAGLLITKYASFIRNELDLLVRQSDNEQPSGSKLPNGKIGLGPAEVKNLIDAAQQYVTELVNAYIASTIQMSKSPRKDTNGKCTGSSFGDALLLLVRFAAYSKFAHPDPETHNPGIPFPIFDRIFKSLCVQYFPHEHLDRPECKYSYGKQSELDWDAEFIRRYPDRLFATHPGKRSAEPNSRERQVYSYLADDINIAAAALCEVDQEWANVFLTTSKDLQNDEDFHLGLAKLGHALHAVEDFFAHSNFTEHAALLRGDQYIQDQLYDPAVTKQASLDNPRASAKLKVVKSDKAAVKVLKRLKRYAPDIDDREARAGWHMMPDEDSVVTGYFDCHDTLLSLSHVLEELLGKRKEKAKQELETIQDIVVLYAQKYVEDRRDEFKDQIDDLTKIVQGRTVEAKASQALLTLLDFFSEASKANRTFSPNEIQSKIKEDELLKTFPPEIVLDLMRITIILCRNKIEQGRTVFNILQLLYKIVEFFENPLEFLVEPLKSKRFQGKVTIEVLYQLLLRDGFRKAKYDLKEGFSELIGGYRIGSHSLLAKDYETEPLYPQMFNFARTLHWYVVDTLCRWSDSVWQKDAKENSSWINWEELLEYFLRHPATYHLEQVRSYYKSKMVAYSTYVVSNHGETFQSIYQRFCRASTARSEIYSYETLIGVNLKHVDVSQLMKKDPVAGYNVDLSKLRDVVVENHLGTALPNGAYELSPGLLVVVPFEYIARVEKVEQSSWYKDVMDLTDEDWKEMVETAQVEKAERSLPAYQYHQWHYFGGNTDGLNASQERDAFLIKTAKLKTRLEHAYQAKHD